MRSRVRVVRRGRERQLRVDGTWASSYRPGEPATGGVWDALAAAVAALPPARRRDILLLGLGGGSAARLARALAPSARIVGVELDAEVVAVARRELDLDGLGLEVRIGDARELVREAGPGFDAVLEDVFVGRGRAVAKPEGFPLPALAHVAGRLRPGGVMASNTLDETAEVRRALRSLLPHRVEIAVEGFDNRIVLGSRAPLDARRLRARLADEPLFASSLPRLRLRTLP